MTVEVVQEHTCDLPDPSAFESGEHIVCRSCWRHYYRSTKGVFRRRPYWENGWEW